MNILILVLLSNFPLIDATKELEGTLTISMGISSHFIPGNILWEQGWHEGFPFEIPVKLPRTTIEYSVLCNYAKGCKCFLSIGLDRGEGRRKIPDTYGYPAFTEVGSKFLFLGTGLSLSWPFGDINKKGERKFYFQSTLFGGFPTIGDDFLKVKVLKNNKEILLYERYTDYGTIIFIGTRFSLGYRVPFGIIFMHIGAQTASRGDSSDYKLPVARLAVAKLGGLQFGIGFGTKNLFEWHLPINKEGNNENY